MKNQRPVSPLRLRRTRQRGHEILEFGLVAILYIPFLMGTFITGMNIIRSIKVNHIARDLADQYIHGADFSTWAMQNVAKRLSTGMGLQIGSSFSGNDNNNTANGGRGLVWVSKLMWIGSTAEANCQSVLPATCTNANKFVFMERIRFGNASMANDRDSTLGNPTANRNSYGIVTDNYITAPAAAVPSPYQSQLNSLLQGSHPNTQPLSDGQTLYVVEVYFQSPDLSLGSYGGRGVYARWFF